MGIFASFMRKVEVVLKGKSEDLEELCTPLLAVSPLSKARNNNDDDDDEVETFDAESHVTFFQDTFEFYKLSVREWAVRVVSPPDPDLIG